MREIKLRTPARQGKTFAQLAIESGARSVVIENLYDAVSNKEVEEVRVKLSTPAARTVIEKICSSPLYNAADYSLSSHEIRSIHSTETLKHLTKPFCMPMNDIYQDLWQNTHLTASFLIRAIASACLMTYGILKAKIIITIGGMLFTVFSPGLMAIGMGFAAKDRLLIRDALRAFLVANVVSIGTAALVALVVRIPLPLDDFGSMGSNVFISIAAAAAASIADADDSGRRQLIAVAAAFPFARFPPWIGACCVLGFPNRQTTIYRFEILMINVFLMVTIAAISYAWLKHSTPIAD